MAEFAQRFSINRDIDLMDATIGHRELARAWMVTAKDPDLPLGARISVPGRFFRCGQPQRLWAPSADLVVGPIG